MEQTFISRVVDNLLRGIASRNYDADSSNEFGSCILFNNGLLLFYAVAEFLFG